MDSSDVKLIISDLDGTLVLYGSNSISNLTKKAVIALQEKGVSFTIATGRSWLQTKSIAAELQITIPVIVQAGAIIIDPVTERVIRRQPLRIGIENKLRHHILDLPQVDRFCLGESGTYFANQVNTSGGDWLLKSGEECRISHTDLRGQDSMVKQLFIGPEFQVKQIYETILQSIRPLPNLILWPPDAVSGDWFLEVFDPLASKGQALKWLTRQLQIRPREIVAFGDGANDLDMLQWAGLGVAMAEASSAVQSQANMVIPGPINDGIAHFLNSTLESGPRVKNFNGPVNLPIG